MKITHEEAQIATGSNNNCSPWKASGVSIDSRTIQENNLFIALKGPNYDGRDFIQAAKEKGAVAAIVSERIETDIPILIVKDTLLALQNLARYKKVQSSATMIAVTGSVGKTTTKEMIYKTLSCYGRAYRNKGNLNNHIGLPLGLLNAPDDAQYIILEMGMNHAGEIAILTNIMQPDIALITNVGPVHLEFFSSVKDIAKAKAEIFIGTKGTVILNRDDEYYDYLLSLTKKYSNIFKTITVGQSQDADIRLSGYNSNSISASLYNKEKVEYEFPINYKHLMVSSLFALAVISGLYLEIPKSLHKLGEISLPEGRGNIWKVRDITIIDESYNANPPSLRAALNLLSQFTGRKIAVLGDMLELGKRAKEFHRGLVNTIIHGKINLIFTVGSNMRDLYDGLEISIRGFHFSSSSDVDMTPYVRKNDTILVKGSRGMKMGLIVKKLIDG